MKNTITTLATLVLLLTTTFAAYSNTIFDENRLQLRMKDGMIQMLYNKSTVENVKIEIINEEGEVIHSDAVSNKFGFLKNYDFSKLDEGFYTFEVSDQEGKVRKEIAFFKRASIALLKQKDDKYRLIYGTKKKSKVSVQMLNNKGKVVFEDNFVSENGFSKTYDVSSENTNATKMRIITQQDSREFELK